MVACMHFFLYSPYGTESYALCAEQDVMPLRNLSSDEIYGDGTYRIDAEPVRKGSHLPTECVPGIVTKSFVKETRETL